MASIATEFPVHPITNPARFVAQVVAWLRGTEYSEILDGKGGDDFEGDSAFLKTDSGEHLHFRQLRTENKLEAIGFRYENPDKMGRKWRTEAVLLCNYSNSQSDLLRLRTECIATRPDAQIETPRKPYLIKSILDDGWGGQDGGLKVASKPLWLGAETDSLNVAAAITRGTASRFLPIVYISATGTQQWVFAQEEIEQLAFDLGGIAHVVVEENRDFSFSLRDITDGNNVYAGAIGISLPLRGYINRLFIGPRFFDVRTLRFAVKNAAIRFRTQMPVSGWDWTDLQERALRRQRERERKSLSFGEKESLYNQEIENLRDQIRQLKAQLEAQVDDASDDSDDWSFHSLLLEKFGPEIYPGEFSDRIRFAAKNCFDKADQSGLDDRSRVVLAAIVKCLPTSPGLKTLLEDLQRAAKDPSNFKSLLLRHGYREKSDNKHVRLEPKKEFVGLQSITLPKTPSDWRSMKNQQKEIEGILGLKAIRGK